LSNIIHINVWIHPFILARQGSLRLMTSGLLYPRHWDSHHKSNCLQIWCSYLRCSHGWHCGDWRSQLL